jgi:hypothetical protein
MGLIAKLQSERDQKANCSANVVAALDRKLEAGSNLYEKVFITTFTSIIYITSRFLQVLTARLNLRPRAKWMH